MGAGAATDFIQDDQRPLGSIVQDPGGLDHLHHEGRLAVNQVICCSYTREDTIGNPQASLLCRNKGTHLCQDRDQCRLANVSRLPSHIWTGDHCQGSLITAQLKIIGGKICPRTASTDHGMETSFHLEDRLLHQFRSTPLLLTRHRCQ